ncbi:cell division protein FtsQ/DivIB [Blattabacterium cuenoti]|uniref:cell division protein FtsQ/DivIB n=1 Tax=Blattabacterium cuenoti TaxID=1653831 RepID=UPI001EEAC5B7|nr:cell division protein FtsQ [Blattabacterium cuenoti]
MKKFHIIIHSKSNNHFINKKIIQNIIFHESNKNEKTIGQLCILEIEKKLNRYPFIRKSEVFLNTNGSIYIEIFQKKPILRIKNNSQEYYLTEDAEELKLSNFYSSPVMLANGAFSKKEKKILVELIEFINSDYLLKDQIISLKKENNHSIILMPKVGNHRIILGDMKDFKNKLNKLRSFYEQYLNKIDINQYQSINLQYKDQVVAKKRLIYGISRYSYRS